MALPNLTDLRMDGSPVIMPKSQQLSEALRVSRDLSPATGGLIAHRAALTDVPIETRRAAPVAAPGHHMPVPVGCGSVMARR
ncbi:hypothetical protein ABZZ79_02770 [Streptomyces sp. NPDC006458]|uniref:hypothetical protein n=1 Tax=Streptomyces sp. NPDC006458 TaxID=3154302 RepID=UPI00339EC633